MGPNGVASRGSAGDGDGGRSAYAWGREVDTVVRSYDVDHVGQDLGEFRRKSSAIRNHSSRLHADKSSSSTDAEEQECRPHFRRPGALTRPG